MTQEKRVLLVRMDKIGDLVLALPADQSSALLGWAPTWLISQGTAFVTKNSVPPRNFIEANKKFSWSEFKKTCKKIRALNPDLAIVLYAPWWVGLALLISGVKNRFSRRSRWHSWIFYNRGLRQSRKHGGRHESELNLELVEAAFGKAATQAKTVAPLRLKAPEVPLVANEFKKANYFVVHPGMAGSALNWPTERWAELVRELIKIAPVAITGTALDRDYTEPLKELLKNTDQVIWLTEKLNIDQLLSLLADAKGVIAPSTGVLHLAASLGTPSVGIYSPLPVQRPVRWGPKGPSVIAIEPPPVGADNQTEARAAMNQIAATQVLQALGELGVLP